jgi:aryl-alcohol dehydrogenase-like predicted oxidoreductase
MQTKKLGQTDIQIAPLVFGGNVFGWTIDENTSFELLDEFHANGFTMIDTADSYSTWVPGNKGGESETIIGNWMKQRNNRDKVILATKVGSAMGEGKKGLSKKYITEAVDASLQRLQTDYLDLYQSHWDDPDTPFEETLSTYEELKKAGKLRWIGASNLTPDRLQQSLDVSNLNGLTGYQCFQTHYNLYERQIFEQALEKICVKNNLGVTSYFSLAGGFLTGKYRSEADLGKSARGGGVKKYLDERGYKILSALDEVSSRYDSTPAAVALAWLINRPSVTAPIASATNKEQLQELMSAAHLELDPEDIYLLNLASAWSVITTPAV